MNIETLRTFCTKLPGVTEDIKWGNDLCFCIAGKMFCVTGLESPLKASFKVKDEEFDFLANSKGIIPAPYLARYKWILIEDEKRLSKKQWEHYIKQSYELIRSKISARNLKNK